MSAQRHSRRAALGLLGAGVAGTIAAVATRRGRPAGTAAQSAAPPPSSTTSRPAPTTTTATTTTTAPLFDTASPYEPIVGEVLPDAKRVAARIAEALTTYGPGDPSEAALDPVMRHAAPGLDGRAVAQRSAPLIVPGARSHGQVVYPQLGGLSPHRDPRRCSVMVVVEQRMRVAGAGDATSTTRCLDIRLRLVGDAWRLEELADLSEPPQDRPLVVSDAAAEVLDHPRILLPDSARWDIYDGLMDERLLREMVIIAERAPIAVTTCRRGHPENVFGTNRRSAHMVGRAVDIWAVRDPVVQQQPDRSSLAYAVTSEIFDAGRVRNLGAPWAFDGPGGRSFTDPVHHDHLHLGF